MGTAFQWNVYQKKLPKMPKMVYKRVRGWTSGQNLPVQKFVESCPRPPGSGVIFL